MNERQLSSCTRSIGMIDAPGAASSASTERMAPTTCPATACSPSRSSRSLKSVRSRPCPSLKTGRIQRHPTALAAASAFFRPTFSHARPLLFSAQSCGAIASSSPAIISVASGRWRAKSLATGTRFDALNAATTETPVACQMENAVATPSQMTMSDASPLIEKNVPSTRPPLRKVFFPSPSTSCRFVSCGAPFMSNAYIGTASSRVPSRAVNRRSDRGTLMPLRSRYGCPSTLPSARPHLFDASSATSAWRVSLA
jgi:hypothetical protein